MNRARPRGHGLAGLFTWRGGDTVPGEITDNPRMRPCPVCRAKQGEPCTRPVRGGRRPMRHNFHDSRKQPEESQ